MADELVVLLDDDLTVIGSAPKAAIHGPATPLHLAFSCHLTGPDGRLLVTRRALGKQAFPGVWTNAVCGHPAPGEEPADAVRRRVRRELGLEVADLDLVLPDFRYRAADAAGVVENELCPVFTATVAGDPDPDPAEVAEWRWVHPDELRAAVAAAPFAFSPWLVLQLAEWPTA